MASLPQQTQLVFIRELMGGLFKKLRGNSWCYFATIVQLLFGLLMTVLRCSTWSTSPSSESTWENVRFSWVHCVMTDLRCNTWSTSLSSESAWENIRFSWVCFASVILRISQQKCTCRETGLLRYGCHTASQFRSEFLWQPYETDRFFFSKLLSYDS